VRSASGVAWRAAFGLRSTRHRGPLAARAAVACDRRVCGRRGPAAAVSLQTSDLVPAFARRAELAHRRPFPSGAGRHAPAHAITNPGSSLAHRRGGGPFAMRGAGSEIPACPTGAVFDHRRRNSHYPGYFRYSHSRRARGQRRPRSASRRARDGVCRVLAKVPCLRLRDAHRWPRGKRPRRRLRRAFFPPRLCPRPHSRGHGARRFRCRASPAAHGAAARRSGVGGRSAGALKR
jgi:hypothetical protein